MVFVVHSSLVCGVTPMDGTHMASVVPILAIVGEVAPSALHQPEVEGFNLTQPYSLQPFMAAHPSAL